MSIDCERVSATDSRSASSTITNSPFAISQPFTSSSASTSRSWCEAGRRVEALSHALLALGVRRGDAVAVLARTRLEWVLLDWAITNIGALVVGIYPTNTAPECAYILEHSESVLAFVEDDAQH